MMKLKMLMTRFVNDCWSVRRFVFAWLIPIVLLPIPMIVTESSGKCAYVMLLMAFYWLTEAMPLPITSLIPVILFPILGVMSSDATCKAYMNGTIMILLGSFITATAVEESGLHHRIALKIILLFGTSPKCLLLGLMLNTALISMWISNVAATALMIPIVNAAIEQLQQKTILIQCKSEENVIIEFREEHNYNSQTRLKRSEPNYEKSLKSKALSNAIFLGICYASNIGGTGTLTGTATNLILNGILHENPVSFSDWMIFNAPVVLILILIAWLFIIIVYMRNIRTCSNDDRDSITRAIRQKYENLGPITFYESAVSILFSALLLIWFFRDPDFVKGWGPMINEQTKFIKDASPAIFIVMFFFLIPAEPTKLKTSPMLLNWKSVQNNVSWGILLLLGGGFAMAEAAEVSGLTIWMGEQLMFLENLPKYLIVIIVCIISLVMTEVASNASTCAILLPVVKRMALALKMSPLSIMLPVTLCCSYAFMLPVATAPNAMIFDAAKMRLKDMAIPGAIMKLICLVIIIMMINSWGPIVLDFNALDFNIENQTKIEISN